jgi:hypothetical protein
MESGVAGVDRRGVNAHWSPCGPAYAIRHWEAAVCRVGRWSWRVARVNEAAIEPRLIWTPWRSRMQPRDDLRDAATAAKRVIDLARADGIQARLELYRSGHPYHPTSPRAITGTP